TWPVTVSPRRRRRRSTATHPPSTRVRRRPSPPRDDEFGLVLESGEVVTGARQEAAPQTRTQEPPVASDPVAGAADRDDRERQPERPVRRPLPDRLADDPGEIEQSGEG